MKQFKYVSDDESAASKPKRSKLLIVSLTVNALFILYIAASAILLPILSDRLFGEQLTAYHSYYCDQRYDWYLGKLDGAGLSQDDTNAQKMKFAATVCQKNYKNGQPLDLTPLYLQVNKTQPQTSLQP